MLARQSEFLLASKPALQKLLGLLKPHFEYVSVLATDVTGTTIRASQRNKSISDYGDGERGFVVRVYKNGGYMEYSFNTIDDVDALASRITDSLTAQAEMLEKAGVEKLETPLMYEERITREFAGEVSEEMYDLDNEAILQKLQALSDRVEKYEHIVECQLSYSAALNQKMFLSENKDMIQAYGVSYISMLMLAFRDGDTQFNSIGATGWQGPEIIDTLNDKIEDAYRDLIAMFDADPIEPGEYDIITTPEGAGLIAHEAFGHGVEMDMFVKDRAIAREHMGEKLASSITNMFDGAQGGVQQSASYFFDDEGTLCDRTQIIKDGYLVSGICDLLSASRLGVTPTGNGRRESYSRKAYTRMTNTYFQQGSDSLEDMIASVEYGYLIDGMNSGMEDPKHWGIQCVMSRAKEIKDGKLTGRMFTPVVLTGYVPDLLSSISMLGTEKKLDGNGHCGKGYKEWVVVSDGGPYLKTKVRLG